MVPLKLPFAPQKRHSGWPKAVDDNSRDSNGGGELAGIVMQENLTIRTWVGEG